MKEAATIEQQSGRIRKKTKRLVSNYIILEDIRVKDYLVHEVNIIHKE